MIIIVVVEFHCSSNEGDISGPFRGTMRELPPLSHGNGNRKENELHSKVTYLNVASKQTTQNDFQMSSFGLKYFSA